jgi:membrane protein YdbS with pleckstrin-like domain
MTDPSFDNDSTRKTTVYESAIDRWVIALLLLSPLTGAALGIYCFANQRADDAAIFFAAAAITLLVSIALTLPCRYTLTSDAVSIRCGLLVFYRVMYRDIKSVELTSTLRSGPALSLKRLEIKTDKKCMIVSPKDRDQFLSDLRCRINAS